MNAKVKHSFAWYKEGDIVEISERDMWLVRIGILKVMEK